MTSFPDAKPAPITVPAKPNDTAIDLFTSYLYERRFRIILFSAIRQENADVFICVRVLAHSEFNRPQEGYTADVFSLDRSSVVSEKCVFEEVSIALLSPSYYLLQLYYIFMVAHYFYLSILFCNLFLNIFLIK